MLFTGGVSIWFVGVVGAIFRGMVTCASATMMVIGFLIQVPVSGALVLGYFGAPQLGLGAVGPSGSDLLIDEHGHAVETDMGKRPSN